LADAYSVAGMEIPENPPEYFLYDQPRPHVARITINRPEVRNAINTPAHKEWSDLLDLAEADDDVWIVVISAVGDQAFCAGRDLKYLSMMQHAPAAEQAADAELMSQVTKLIERFDYSKPLIAAVNGIALGGGFEVAMACDLVVAADHVRFGLPEPRRGIYAGGGGVHRLPRQIPLKLAMEYLLTGRTMAADRALELGIINRVVPSADLDAAVNEYIDDILLGAPLSIRATKQSAMRGLDMSLSDAFYGDFPAVKAMARSDDAREGPKAFAEKRTPTWTGR
jgi:enoyl-CoA hydratase/carnithine racemase